MNNFEERLQERLKELRQSKTSVSSDELIGFEAGATWCNLATPSIDNVTVERLDIALRVCGIELHKSIIDRIIDLVELIAEKGDEASIRDISELKTAWGDNKKDGQ